MPNPINTIPIQQFLQLVKSAELSNQKEIKLDIKTAKNLVYCLGEITSKLVADYDKVILEIKESQGNSVELKMDGGGFNDN